MDKEKFLEKIKEEQEELKASLISIFTPFVYDSELLEYCSIREEEDYIVSSIELRDKPHAFCELAVYKMYYKEDEGNIDVGDLQIDVAWNDFNDRLRYTSANFPDMSNKTIVDKVKMLIITSNHFVEYANNRRLINLVIPDAPILEGTDAEKALLDALRVPTQEQIDNLEKQLKDSKEVFK